MSDIVCTDDNSQNYPKWSTLDLVRWKTISGTAYLEKYKDGYIVFHRDRIKASATQHKIPDDLLASVAWVEAGGKPDWIKTDVVFPLSKSF